MVFGESCCALLVVANSEKCYCSNVHRLEGSPESFETRLGLALAPTTIGIHSPAAALKLRDIHVHP